MLSITYAIALYLQIYSAPSIGGALSARDRDKIRLSLSSERMLIEFDPPLETMSKSWEKVGSMEGANKGRSTRVYVTIVSCKSTVKA